jgi:hypothetical protein
VQDAQDSDAEVITARRPNCSAHQGEAALGVPRTSGVPIDVMRTRQRARDRRSVS